jgi:hypothetical protein
MARFVGTKVEFDADTDEFALNIDARALPLIHSDSYLNDLLLKYCETALADRRGNMSQFRTRVAGPERRQARCGQPALID